MAAAGKAVTRVVRRCHDGRESQVLDLSACTLKAFPDAVFLLMKSTLLETCILEDNQISRLPVKFFHNFQSLTVLNLSNNRMSFLPDSVVEMNALVHLDISCNSFTQFPNVTLGLPKIQAVNAEHNEISDVNTDSLDRIGPNLKKVNLVNNPLCYDYNICRKAFNRKQVLLWEFRTANLAAVQPHFHINSRRAFLELETLRDEGKLVFDIVYSPYRDNFADVD